MYQKFQEFFKENNIRVLLKYDGERKRNTFTVMFFDKDSFQSILRSDTDLPLEIFKDFVKQMDIKIDDKLVIEYFEIFIRFKDKLAKSINNKFVFSLTSECERGNILHRIIVISDKKNIDFQSMDFNECFNRI